MPAYANDSGTSVKTATAISWILLGTGLLPSLSAAAQEGAGRSTEALVFNCFTCHGPRGRGSEPIPAIGGKPAADLLGKLRDFRNGRRDPTIMDRIARGYTDEELGRIADYLSSLK